MSSVRTSFHIQPSTKQIVAENGDQAKRINFLIQAVPQLIKSPTLDYASWMVIVAAANGYTPNWQADLKKFMNHFANSIVYADIFGKEFEINKEQLAIQFYQLPIHEQLFAFELARKFWIKRDPIAAAQSYKEWLIDNGAIIKE